VVFIDRSHLIDQHLLWGAIPRRSEDGDAIEMIAGWEFRP
jgi:hypothetical protein